MFGEENFTTESQQSWEDDREEGQGISINSRKIYLLPGGRKARTGMRGVRNDSAGVASISPVLTGFGGDLTPGPMAALSARTTFVSRLWKRIKPAM